MAYAAIKALGAPRGGRRPARGREGGAAGGGGRRRLLGTGRASMGVGVGVVGCLDGLVGRLEPSGLYWAVEAFLFISHLFFHIYASASLINPKINIYYGK